MKKNNILFRKFVNIIIEKRQIIFALFAYVFFYLIFTDENELLLKSAVPVAVAAAAKAAVAGAKVGAVKGAASGAINKKEGESILGAAAKGASSGAIRGAAGGAVGGAKDGLTSGKNSGINVQNNVNNKNNLNTQNVDIGKNNNFENKNDLKTNNDKNANNGKNANNDKNANTDEKSNNNIIPKEEDYEEEMPEEQNTNSPKNKKKFLVVGCFTLFFLCILFFPILLTIIISPITKIFSGLDCASSTSVLCSNEDNSSFWEKAENFFQYGSFNSTDNVINKKLDKTYEKYYNEYNVKIDVPLLLSTLLVDAIEYDDQVIDIESGAKYDVNDVLKKRVEYLDELADMQTVTIERTYLCTYDYQKDSYIQQLVETRQLEFNEKEKSSGGCRGDGSYVYDYYKILDLENYYDRLYKYPDVLSKVYNEDFAKYDTKLKILIQQIEGNKDLFDGFYNEENANVTPGNIPVELQIDANVNLSSPLMGNYSITLKYGKRNALSFGRHKGIDLVSDDTNIYASGNGVVSAVYTERLGGNVVEITHTTSSGKRYVTQYAHLSQVNVSVGDTINTGNVIGIMGSTGETTGVHLHYQMFDADTKETYNTIDLFS